jgi:hypothetical protein
MCSGSNRRVWQIQYSIDEVNQQASEPPLVLAAKPFSMTPPRPEGIAVWDA